MDRELGRVEAVDAVGLEDEAVEVVPAFSGLNSAACADVGAVEPEDFGLVRGGAPNSVVRARGCFTGPEDRGAGDTAAKVFDSVAGASVAAALDPDGVAMDARRGAWWCA